MVAEFRLKKKKLFSEDFNDRGRHTIAARTQYIKNNGDGEYIQKVNAIFNDKFLSAVVIWVWCEFVYAYLLVNNHCVDKHSGDYKK